MCAKVFEYYLNTYNIMFETNFKYKFISYTNIIFYISVLCQFILHYKKNRNDF